MKGKHHMIAGVCAGACLTASALVVSDFGFVPIVGGFIGTVVGSLFPDIDSSTSKLGSKIKIVSKIINNLFGHRGLLHCPLLIVGLFFLFRMLFRNWGITDYSIVYIGFLLGMLMHLVCDITTRGGIPVLYPFYTMKFSLTPMKSGSKWEPLMLGVIMLFAIVCFVACVLNDVYLTSFPWLI